MLKEILKEVSARESAAGIIPDADIDIYMKVKDVLSFYALAGIILPHFTKKSNT